MVPLVNSFGTLFHLSALQVIHYYLKEIVFPRTMRIQRVKISASGQELGSEMLFGRRLGFSGTPSNLLPTKIAPCHFEKGSEGKILRTLTDNDITMEAPLSQAMAQAAAAAEAAEASGDEGHADRGGWTVEGLLDQIANGAVKYSCLVDTGALITGYSNEEVARYLVDNGLRHMQGCVFLDHRDRKMIYLRGAARAIPLRECGISNAQRFTFFDQVHTTGMDIKQSLSAVAILTVGKDMTFRDYAQGAYRMRGIGKGQCIHLLTVPEIKRLMDKELGADIVTGKVEVDVAAWLQLNGMKAEKLQFLQLCAQNMQTVWRKVAFEGLLASSGVQGIAALPPIDDRDTAPIASNPHGTSGGTMRFIEGDHHNALTTCIEALRDQQDFDIPSVVPVSEPYEETMVRVQKEHSALLQGADAKRTVEIVMQQVRDTFEKGPGVGGGGEKKGLDSEMTREKEREQEQQKQKQQQKQSESMYCRDKGRALKWPTTLLFTPPVECIFEDGAEARANAAALEEKGETSGGDGIAMPCKGCGATLPSADQYYKHVKQCSECSEEDRAAAIAEMDKEMNDANYPFYPLNQFSPRPREFKFKSKNDEDIVMPRIEPLQFPEEILQVHT